MRYNLYKFWNLGNFVLKSKEFCIFFFYEGGGGDVWVFVVCLIIEVFGGECYLFCFGNLCIIFGEL